MTYAIVTMHDSNYSALADITYEQNKKPYCEYHGYYLFAKTNNFSAGKSVYFDKIRYCLEVLENNPTIKWIWWLDCDAVITNFKTTIEEWCNDNFDFIVTLDRYALNNGSYFLKNSTIAKQFLRDILALEQQHLTSQWPDQQPMIDLIAEHEHYQKMTEFHSQRDFNSYDYDFYHKDHGNTHDWDLFGNNGNWQEGDFVCHYPGVKYESKLELAKNILEKVIK